MHNDTLKTQLQEIADKIAQLPEGQRGALQALLEETRHRHDLIRQATDHARHALDDWRLAQKYHIFDMEARLREQAESSDPPDDASHA